MQKLQPSDVKDLVQYEKVREAFRRQIVELKQRRRVSVGPMLTFVFENRETVLFQIQEMVRAERIVKEEEIAFEVEVYNGLIPERDELSATLLIEITDKRRVKALLDRFIGLDRGDAVWLEFGEERVYARFEAGRSREDKISAVHFVRFPFTAQQSRRFRSGEDAAYLAVHHNDYKRKALLPPEVRQSVSQDLDG